MNVFQRFQRLYDVATADGFENTGRALVLHFVKLVNGIGKEWRAEIAGTAREARRIIKDYESKGWKNCWRVWGDVHIPA
ncbi:MAG: hypothetical protein FJ271_31665 [Planctomycetes bacterium]|nr:hypothetical protein [Planctomycetota bacterium]